MEPNPSISGTPGFGNIHDSCIHKGFNLPACSGNVGVGIGKVVVEMRSVESERWESQRWKMESEKRGVDTVSVK